jgi:hypothetical protein
MGRPVRTSQGYPWWRCDANDATSLLDLTPDPGYFRAPVDEFTRRYVAQLDRVGVEALRQQFQLLDDGRPLVLLCFERIAAHCHRRLFAEWWQQQTGEVIPEVGEAP